ncbi:hypothetical protein Cgig2_027978 [Carnegiea gigantea]|uniref:Retrotransposon gag domain-containing protein n=1 Tax=Carnegiea gigantea TaxID=171969 RepID=A0A9Q1Q7I7_9CARY|nr:hypothetical protein Cgig2_027978 [Carnegiea gigantea]
MQSSICRSLESLFFSASLRRSGSLSIQEKLVGANNCRSQRRNVEIALATKRKLEFVQGTISRRTDDDIKVECGILATITWIRNFMTNSIGKSILFLNSARKFWVQLEQRFSLSNGSRKYKINKEINEVKQNHLSVNEYYTRRSFLNGLDDKYGPQRSQLLLMSPLPSVEAACSSIQQEESHRKRLETGNLEVETTALFSKNANAKGCSQCGNEEHTKEKYWLVIGYPSLYPLAKNFPQKRNNKTQAYKGKYK